MVLTLKEALKARLIVSASDALIESAFIESGLNSESQLTAGNSSELLVVEFQLLKVLVSLPDISEGDLSIKQNKEGMKLRLLFLAKALGRVDEIQDTPTEEQQPSVTSVRPW